MKGDLLMTDIFWLVWSFISLGSEAFSITYFLSKQLGFTTNKLKWVIISVVIYVLFNYIWHSNNMDPFLLLIVAYILILTFAFTIYSGNASQKLLISSIGICVIVLGNVITSIIVSVFLEPNLTKTLVPSMTRLMGTILYIVTIFTILMLLSKRKKNAFELPMFLRVFVVILVAIQVIVSILLLSFGYESGTNDWLKLRFIIVGTLFSIMIPVMLIIIDMLGGIMHQKNMTETQLQLAKLEAKHAENILESEKSLNILRHDMKNHLLAINGYIDIGDINDLKKYLKQLNTKYSAALSAPVNTGHNIIDAILSQKNMIANTSGIKVEFNVT